MTAHIYPRNVAERRTGAGLFPGVLVDLKGSGGMGHKLVPPLVVLRLADLVLGANVHG
jgi:hypothetical protein